MKCAVIVGHTKEKPGASNSTYLGNEFAYNKCIAILVQDFMRDSTIEVLIVHRDTYETLPDDINALNVDFAVSLHCNAFNNEVNGTSTLYNLSADHALDKLLAETVQLELCRLNYRDRGIKPIQQNHDGGYLLYNCNCPIVIAEPFYIDNDNAYLAMVCSPSQRRRLAMLYAQAIINFSIQLNKYYEQAAADYAIKPSEDANNAKHRIKTG